MLYEPEHWKRFTALLFDEMLNVSRIWSVFSTNDVFVVSACKYVFRSSIVLYNVQANGSLLSSRDVRTVANHWQFSAIK